jgi:hypothetical protein
MGNSIDELASYVQPLCLQFIADCQMAGDPVTIEDTGRDYATQQADIAAGRSWTKNSKHLPQPPEMKSEAFDAVPRSLAILKQWGWYGAIESSDPRWLAMGERGEALGLEWGGRWHNNPPHSRPDPGHFQFVHKVSESPEIGVEESTT